MTEMQRIINAKTAICSNVRAYVAFTLKPISREERAQKAKSEIASHFNDKQRRFIDFVCRCA
jgi:type I restriction enzyme R subunit